MLEKPAGVAATLNSFRAGNEVKPAIIRQRRLRVCSAGHIRKLLAAQRQSTVRTLYVGEYPPLPRKLVKKI
jgi:hypothetical protein